nr:MAG TPA: hypothetical protein [Caudoviricetes sp.]
MIYIHFSLPPFMLFSLPFDYIIPPSGWYVNSFLKSFW